MAFQQKLDNAQEKLDGFRNTKLFNKISRTEKMSNELRSIVELIQKNKGLQNLYTKTKDIYKVAPIIKGLNE